jgi:hypothetical protein
MTVIFVTVVMRSRIDREITGFNRKLLSENAIQIAILTFDPMECEK